MYKLRTLLAFTWIKIQVKVIRWKLSVLTWQADRLVKRFTTLVDK